MQFKEGGIELGGKGREKWEKRATAAATHCHCKMNKGQECRCTLHLQRHRMRVLK